MVTIRPLVPTGTSKSKYLNYSVYDYQPSQFFPGVQIVESYRYNPETKTYEGTGEWKWCTYEQQQGSQELFFDRFKSFQEAENHLQEYYKNWVLSLIAE